MALQALYSWQMTSNSLEKIELDIAAINDFSKVDSEYFTTLVRGCILDYEHLDLVIKPYLGRLPEELDQVEKAILRLATYELLNRDDVPFKVVINEAIELAKLFGAEASHRFINGVLDKAMKTLRPRS
jgi:N utilization substance protein B